MIGRTVRSPRCKPAVAFPSARPTLIGTLAAVAALLAGCASEYVLSDRYRPDEAAGHVVSTEPVEPSISTPVSTIGRNCPVGLGVVTDLRPEPSLVGLLGGVGIKSAAGLKGWTSSAFQTLLCPSTIDAVGASSNAPRLVLDIDVLKAWMSDVGPALSTSLVVKVRYVRSNIVVKEATYRGSDTSADLFRTQAQIQWEFDSAMRQILRQVRTDLTEVAQMQAGLSN